MKLMRLGALGYALISIFLWPSKVAAAIVNRTIDDQRGDSVTGSQVIYYPADVWNDQTCGNKCSITPNASQAFDGTYTAGTYSPGTGGTAEIRDLTTSPSGGGQSEPSGGLQSSPSGGGQSEPSGGSQSEPPIPSDGSSTKTIGISMQFTGRIHNIFVF